jgi:hypothetical protein
MTREQRRIITEAFINYKECGITADPVGWYNDTNSLFTHIALFGNLSTAKAVGM